MSDVATILPIAGCREVRTTPFQNNDEHLSALEYEVGLMLTAALNEQPAEPAASRSDASSVSREEVQRTREENRLRERVTREKGISLNMPTLWERFGLNETERDILLVLLMKSVAPRLKRLLHEFTVDGSSCGDGVTVGTLLKIICPDFLTQLSARRCFSIDGAMIRDGLIEVSSLDETESILDQRVSLMERVVQFVIGDDSLYPGYFSYIKRERPQVSLSQVVLPEAIKAQVLRYVVNYKKLRSNVAAEALDRFYGYGTGLTMMFHGPSGSGKTMLAQGLAHHLQAPLFTLTADQIHRSPRGCSDILSTLFREANLHEGVVLFDEADDMFASGTGMSRALLIELERARCMVILATNKPDILDPALERRLSLKVAFPLPDHEARHAIWTRLLPSCASMDEDVDIRRYAERYRFSGGTIKNCLHMAVTQALVETPENPVITASMLDEAVRAQMQRGIETKGCGQIGKDIRILAELPLRAAQREELQRIKTAWQRLERSGAGLALHMVSSSLENGKEVALSLVAEVGLEASTYDFDEMMLNRKEEYLHPVTQEEIPLLEFAFAQAADGTHAMILLDDNGGLDEFLRMSEESGKDKSLLLSHFLRLVRNHKGLLIFVSRSRRCSQLPPEFVVSLTLREPEESLQCDTWQRHLSGSLCRNDIHELVTRHPLHLEEIITMACQANVFAVVEGCEHTNISHVNEILRRHGKQRRDCALLFGGNS